MEKLSYGRLMQNDVGTKYYQTCSGSKTLIEGEILTRLEGKFGGIVKVIPDYFDNDQQSEWECFYLEKPDPSYVDR